MNIVRRFNRKKREYENVKCPAVVREFNSFMGGIDLLGSHINQGRIRMKSRK